MSTDLIPSPLTRLKAGCTQVDFIHKPHIRLATFSTKPSRPRLQVQILPSLQPPSPTSLFLSFNPPTLAHRALTSLGIRKTEIVLKFIKYTKRPSSNAIKTHFSNYKTL